jgi:hypothetical protein
VVHPGDLVPVDLPVQAHGLGQWDRNCVQLS